MDTATGTVSCVWCGKMLAADDAELITVGRLPRLPDEENMECRDHDACDQRQDALDAVLVIRARAHGESPSPIKVTPGVLAAIEDGDRLREAMAALERDYA